MSTAEPAAMIGISWDGLAALCSTAITIAGGDEQTAAALSDAVLAAERRGNTAVGVTHLFDYLDALRRGRLNGAARPRIRRDRAAVISVSADDGVAQLGFRAALPELAAAARANGIAVLSINDAFTVGELGYFYVRGGQTWPHRHGWGQFSGGDVVVRCPRATHWDKPVLLRAASTTRSPLNRSGFQRGGMGADPRRGRRR